MAVDPFVPEAWTWLSVTLTIIIARYVSRFLQVKSIRRMGWEDLIMLFVTFSYIAEINFLVKIEFTPTNLIMPGSYFDPNDAANVALREWGSKLVVIQETNNCALIWGTKACLLLYYAKLIYALPGSYRWTVITAIYAAVGYVVMMVLYFAYWCQPFDGYWQVPASDSQCATAQHHLIVNFVLNVTSDLMILAIPLPLLVRTKLPPRKKLALVAAFSFGLFNITSAILSKFYSFTNPWGDGWEYWFARESSSAVIIANIPHLWSLVRRIFKLHSFVGSAPVPSNDHLSNAPARFYQDVEDPLSPKRHKNSDGSLADTLDSYDIDRVLADVERSHSGLSGRSGLSHPEPPKPSRFRDLKQGSAAMGDRNEKKDVVAPPVDLPKSALSWKGHLRLPSAQLPSYLLKPTTPLSPMNMKFERQ